MAKNKKKFNNGNKNIDQQSNTQEKSNKKDITDAYLERIKTSLTEFNDMTPEKRTELFGEGEFLDQFWAYFQEKNKNILTEIESKDHLKIYLETMEEEGFTVEDMTGNLKETNKLHETIKETDDETQASKEVLKDLKVACEKKENGIPNNTFKNFLQNIGADYDENTDEISLDPNGSLKTIDQIDDLWTNFLKDNGIKLTSKQEKNFKFITKPDYIPTERLMIQIAIQNIKKKLKGDLLKKFNEDFPTPIDMFSDLKNLIDFRSQLQFFFNDNQDQIDENFKKEINSIIVTNRDIIREMDKMGFENKSDKSFIEQEKNFKRVMNKIINHQLFKDIKKTNAFIEQNIDHVAKALKVFPPFLNEVFAKYPYNEGELQNSSPELFNKINGNQDKLVKIEAEIDDQKTTPEQKKILKEQKNKLKKEIQDAKRKAYISYLQTKNEKLAHTIQTLKDNNFDMSKINTENQQKILDNIIENELNDMTQNQVPELLDINKDEFNTFIKDLFDLKKKTITIPSKDDNIQIGFNEKSFLGGPLSNIDISDKNSLPNQNFPLNLGIDINNQNEDFFENNFIFKDLFETFNGQKINEGYLVNIKKNGKEVKGYLSSYPPSEELKNEDTHGKNSGHKRYLYSHPITKPEDARTLISRDEEGNEPVVIKEEEQSLYNLEIIKKQLNFTGQSIGALIFSYIIAQQAMTKKLSNEKESQLEQKFGDIDKQTLYKDTLEKKDQQDKPEEKEPTEQEKQEEKKEKQNEEFLNEREKLDGYKDKKDKTRGFKKGTKLLIRVGDSEMPPQATGGHAYMTAEITKINENKGTFTIKLKGGELGLGKYEGASKELPMNTETLKFLGEKFEKIFKLPPSTGNLTKDIEAMKENEIQKKNIEQCFPSTLQWEGNKLIDTRNEGNDKTVQYFGFQEEAIGEAQDKQISLPILYKITYNADKTITIKSDNIIEGNEQKKYTKTMTYQDFITFIASKQLKPKTETEAKTITETANSKQQNEKFQGPTAPKRKRGPYSINNVLGFFKTFGSKIKDAVKKYDDEKTDDLTNFLVNDGKLFKAIGSIIPLPKRKTAFENVGDEYMLERDGKTRKQIEKRVKLYTSDPDFGSDTLRGAKIKTYINGDKKLKNHYQAAAMLLATVQKGKGPYSRNADRVGKGKWIRLLLGENHQQRYLVMKQKKEQELREKSAVNGGKWTDQMKDDILKLEMKYIVHVIDGRELRSEDSDHLKAMFSSKFAGELDTAYNDFFNQKTIQENYEKNKGASFEFARFEFYRLITDRPQQALGMLKVMAEKASNKQQRDTFKMAVLGGMLSGIFLNMTESSTQGWIVKMCRTIGFMPGMIMKDPFHQAKIARLLTLASGDKNFNTSSGYDKFLGGGEAKDFIGREKSFYKRCNKDNNLKKTIDFFEISKNNKTDIMSMENDPKTAPEDKMLIQEILNKSLKEKNEELDGDLKESDTVLKNAVLMKSQSVVDEVIDFKGGNFSLRNKDAIQSSIDFRGEVADAIPTDKIESEAKIEFFVNRFLNRFEYKGFQGAGRALLVRALKTAKNELTNNNKESAKNILRYTLAGNIINKSGSDNPPKVLEDALTNFSTFFEKNLDIITKESFLERVVGGEYAKEKALLVANREEYSDIMENKVSFGLSPQENKLRSQKRTRYTKSDIYINGPLYKLANDLERKNSIMNEFKKNKPTNAKNTTKNKEELKNILGKKGIHIKNPEITNKIKNTLNGVNPNEEMQAAMQALEEEQDNVYDDY